MKFLFSNSPRPDENLERALRRPPAAPKADADLHGSIMRAVREAREKTSQQDVPASNLFPWMTFGTGIALAALSLGLWLRPAPKVTVNTVVHSELSQAPATALDFGAQLPALVMSPYSNEWARVDQDLHTTTQDLLASLP